MIPGRALFLVPIALAAPLLLSLLDPARTQPLFVHSAYYYLLGTLLCWLGVHAHAARSLPRGAFLNWARENWRGVAIALGVTLIAALAVEPALRVLSDEANLVGTSKNLFTSKSPTFTISGKNYYGSYWDVDVAIDRRPTLFPFCVSLAHTLFGYSHDNAFLVNLLVLPAFVLVAYRLAKTVGTETFACVAALCVVAHPITLLSVRSAGFDFFAAFFGLLALKSLLDLCRDTTPTKLAVAWMNLCLFANVRYESALFLLPAVALLLAFRMLRWELLRPAALLYALTPAFLLPRLWQAMLRGSVPEQEPGTVTFSIENFSNNLQEYFRPLFELSHAASVHSPILIALGLVACVFWLRWAIGSLRAPATLDADTKVALRCSAFVGAWMLVQLVVVFAYFWGRAQYPSAARLVIPLDTFFSLAAAWVVTRSFERWRPVGAVLAACGLFVLGLPTAAHDKFMNRLTQTRESAATWRFFEQLPDKRILIVTDRPNHFTIMNYGAMSFEAARRDPHLLRAFERRLFADVYVIQQLHFSTGEPAPGYQLWPDRTLQPVFEFQNDADLLVRVSKLVR